MQPSTSTQAQRKASGSAAPKGTRRTSRATSGGDKKKRQRVSSAQLAQLESIFAVERTPTQERRREISQTLGMDERQTKVWFQNRRAKMSRDAKDGVPVVMSPGIDTLMQLFREQEGVTFLPCVDLRIGSWRRIRDPQANDLAAFVCHPSRSLSWFVHAGGRCYEMTMPFDTIIKLEYNEHPALDSIFASITLSQPPTFWSDELRDSAPENPWQVGVDWTETHQASTVLTHIVAGSKVHFMELQRLLECDRNPELAHASGQASPECVRRMSLSPLMSSERQDAAAATQSHLGHGHPASSSYAPAPPMDTKEESLPPVPFSGQPLESLSQPTVLAAPVPTKPPLILPVRQQAYPQPWSAGPPSVSPPRTASSEASSYSLPPNLPAPPIPPQPQTQFAPQPSRTMPPPPNVRMAPSDTMPPPHQSMPPPPPPPHTMPPPSMGALPQASQQALPRRAVSYQMPERVTRQTRRHEPYDAAAARRASTGSALQALQQPAPGPSLQPPSAYGAAAYSYEPPYSQPGEPGQRLPQSAQQSQPQIAQGQPRPPSPGAAHAPAIRRLSVSFGQQQPVEMRLEDDAYPPGAQQVYNLPPPSAYGSSSYVPIPPASFPAAPPARYPPVPPPASYQAPESLQAPEAAPPAPTSPAPSHTLPDSPLLTKPWIPPPHVLEGLKRDAAAAEAEKRTEAARKKAEIAQRAAEEAQRAAEEARREAEAEEAAQRELMQRAQREAAAEREAAQREAAQREAAQKEAAQREAAQREAAQRSAAQRMLPPIQEAYRQPAYYVHTEYYPAQNYAPPPANNSAPSPASASPTPPAQYVYDPTTGMYMNMAYQYR
ncbi:hypothetical protein HDZ31DRAFT_35674 [Schizophyllum fasciatum]